MPTDPISIPDTPLMIRASELAARVTDPESDAYQLARDTEALIVELREMNQALEAANERYGDLRDRVRDAISIRD